MNDNNPTIFFSYNYPLVYNLLNCYQLLFHCLKVNLVHLIIRKSCDAALSSKEGRGHLRHNGLTSAKALVIPSLSSHLASRLHSGNTQTPDTDPHVLPLRLRGLVAVGVTQRTSDLSLVVWLSTRQQQFLLIHFANLISLTLLIKVFQKLKVSFN